MRTELALLASLAIVIAAVLVKANRSLNAILKDWTFVDSE